MKGIAFAKMVGTGNDFVIVDHRKPFLKDLAQTARQICHRKFGIGADGFLLIERSKRADLKMRIFNPDGSEAEMCGNGIRCFAEYAYRRKWAPRVMEIETLAGVMTAKVLKDGVQVTLKRPKDERLRIPIEILGQRYQVHYVETGVPHTAMFVDELETVDVELMGRMIRNHHLFQPRGTNVDFVQLTGKRAIAIRTYERGVEGETLACGTGAVASSVLVHRLHRVRPPIDVRLHSGESVRVSFDDRDGFIDNVSLSGPVKMICEGRWIASLRSQ